MVHGRLSSMFGAEADPPTPSHHQCEGRPPALQASRAQRAINSAVASAACLKGRPGPVTPSTDHPSTFELERDLHLGTVGFDLALGVQLQIELNHLGDAKITQGFS